MLSAGLIDRITVSLHPVLLGNGIRLFPDGFPKTSLTLEDSAQYDSGLVQLNYHVQPVTA
jgi:dihydrofolate reductase